MADLIQLRKDTEANWIEADPILAQGEHAITLDNLDTEPKFKIGDGIHLWSELPYFGGGGTGCCPEVIRFDLMDYNDVSIKLADIPIGEDSIGGMFYFNIYADVPSIITTSLQGFIGFTANNTAGNAALYELGETSISIHIYDVDIIINGSTAELWATIKCRDTEFPYPLLSPDEFYIDYAINTMPAATVVVNGGGSGELTQLQSDWEQTDDTQVDYIKNKPGIPDLDVVTCKYITLGENILLDGSVTVYRSANIANGDFILVNGQTDKKQNGIYIANTSGWTRASNLSRYVYVIRSPRYGNTSMLWGLMQLAPVVGTDAIEYFNISVPQLVDGGAFTYYDGSSQTLKTTPNFVQAFGYLRSYQDMYFTSGRLGIATGKGAGKLFVSDSDGWGSWQTITIGDGHTHDNKDLLDHITDEGDGDLFLADDGTYKEIPLKRGIEVQSSDLVLTSSPADPVNHLALRFNAKANKKYLVEYNIAINGANDGHSTQISHAILIGNGTVGNGTAKITFERSNEATSNYGFDMYMTDSNTRLFNMHVPYPNTENIGGTHQFFYRIKGIVTIGSSDQTVDYQLTTKIEDPAPVSHPSLEAGSWCKWEEF